MGHCGAEHPQRTPVCRLCGRYLAILGRPIRVTVPAVTVAPTALVGSLIWSPNLPHSLQRGVPWSTVDLHDLSREHTSHNARLWSFCTAGARLPGPLPRPQRHPRRCCHHQSVSLIPSAPTTAPHSPDWSPSALPSSHSAVTRLRQIRPPITLHIGRESDLQAIQGQSWIC